MHRAKHRAAGRASAEVLATTLIERFAVDTGVRAASTRHAGTGSVALAERPEAPAGLPEDRDLGETGLSDPALFGVALFGAATPTASFLAVTGAEPDEVASRAPAPLFRAGEPGDDEPTSPFGASRHAARRPTPARPGVKLRPQPFGAAVTVTVLGAAAAVTAIVSSPVGVESTGELPPVEKAAPDPGPDTLTGPDVDALAAAPEQPTMRVADLVSGVTAEMDRVNPALVEARYATVANSSPTASAAAMRRAAVSNALSKLGKPYRWGASGPNAFDCSGLVKWSFAQAGRTLPRTSRAQSTVGTPVSRADLQPGDLVFFYRPISHVGIYIGNGKVVHASRKGQPVKISDMSRMRFTKAVRL